MRLQKMVSAPVAWFMLLLTELGLMPAADAAGGRYLPNRRARRRAVALARAGGYGPGVSVSRYYLNRVEGRLPPNPGLLRARRLAVERLDRRS
jgi:hypothetical protein